MRRVIVIILSISVSGAHDRRQGTNHTSDANNFMNKFSDNLVEELFDQALNGMPRHNTRSESGTLGRFTSRPASLLVSSVLPPVFSRRLPHSFRMSAWTHSRPHIHRETALGRHMRVSAWPNPFDVFGNDEDEDSDDITVARVQVGLLGTARELQREIESIADSADTDSQEGLHKVLVETTLSLIRNPQYFAYGYVDSDFMRSPTSAEEKFDEYSLEERAKFQTETRSNVGGKTRTSSLSGDADKQRTQYIIVTILVAYDGRFKLPQIASLSDAKDVLQKLGRTQVSRVNAVEVLWTPEAEGDTLTPDELIMNYPKLLPL